MNFLLDTTVDYSKPIEGFGEQFKFGLEMLLLGMAAVFAVLCIIWLSLVIFRMVFHDLPGRKGNQPKAEAIPTSPAPVVPSFVGSQDEEIVAVIAAAIAMAESENNGMKFRVVSFKKR